MANNGSSAAGLQVFLIISSTSITALRFLSRNLSPAGVWWDDYMILLALVGERSLPSDVISYKSDSLLPGPSI
jgi:hypothetical protein